METFRVRKFVMHACNPKSLIEKIILKGFDELYGYFRKENGGELSKEFVEGICKHSYTKVYGESNGLNYTCYYVSKG
jgi:hypothetical protein